MPLEAVLDNLAADDVGDDGQTKASLAQRIKKRRGFRTQRTNINVNSTQGLWTRTSCVRVQRNPFPLLA